MFFFEKKNQKTFTFMAYAVRQGVRHDIKSFCFFFQKEALASFWR
jgi:hypothetical protein